MIAEYSFFIPSANSSIVMFLIICVTYMLSLAVVSGCADVLYFHRCGFEQESVGMTCDLIHVSKS
jgi:hypothetical protein